MYFRISLDLTMQMLDDLGISLDINMIPKGVFIDNDMDDMNIDQIPISTNPFAPGLEEAEREAEEEEQRRLKELEDANSVPAIVSDNRGKLQTIWKDNMQRWKSGDSRIQMQDEDIQEKKNRNEEMRREIQRLQSKFGNVQEAVEAKGMIGFFLVTHSSNHLLLASIVE